MLGTQSEIVIDLAKRFILEMQISSASWEHGFFRFEADGLKMGASASYQDKDGVFILGALRKKDFFDEMNLKGERLFQEIGKDKGVFILRVDSNFDYKIDFDFENSNRWKITKIDGNSGIPEGYFG